MTGLRDGGDDSTCTGIKPGICSIPAELLSHVLCFLRPQDLVRVRSVSKLFRDLSHDLTIWKRIYANTSLPRPPGPFPFQSARFLEQTLIRSERLEKSWTTKPIQAFSRTVTPIGRLPWSPGDIKFLEDRWVIIFDGNRILFVNLETHSQHVVWEDLTIVERIYYGAWDACSVMTTCGHLFYVLFSKNRTWRLGRQELIDSLETLKLLEFKVDEQSGHVSHSICLDVPTEYQLSSVRIVADLMTPFLYIPGPARPLIFDTRTQTFYVIPGFRTGLLQRNAETSGFEVSLTNTHIIVFSYRRSPESTVIRAFVLPEYPFTTGNEVPTLCLSHEGIIYNLSHDGKLILVRNPSTKPLLENTTFRFLHANFAFELDFSLVELTLPKLVPNTVLPISVGISELLSVDAAAETHTMSPWGFVIETSDDGRVRGLCRDLSGDEDEDEEEDVDRYGEPKWLWNSFTKFTIDATGGKCVVDVGRAMQPRWGDEEDRQYCRDLHWVAGRYSYLKPGPDSNEIVCVDFE